MSLIDDLREFGARKRITEEMLYAEVLREIETGLRRDGLWAKALAQSNMQEGPAQARYIELRVQALRDEIALVATEQDTSHDEGPKHNQSPAPVRVVRRTAASSKQDEAPKSVKDWWNVLVGAMFVIGLGVVLVLVVGWLTNR
jgi:hypothetical protein